MVDNAGLVVLRNPAGGATIAQFNLADIAARVIRTPIEVPRATIKADADALLARLDEQQGALLGHMLKALPDKGFDQVMNTAMKALGTDVSKDVARALSGPAAAGASNVLGESLAGFALGRDLVQRTGVAAPTAAAGAPAPGNGGGAGSTPEEQAALAALAATGPYGVAAAMAIKVLSGMGELADLADQANRLDVEDRGLTVELLHLTPLKHQVDVDESLAQLAHRVAQLRSQSAANRGNLLQAALVDDGQRRIALSGKIRSRLPLNYYLAELLREQYDRLDQSLSTWTGDSASPGSRLESWLRGDPRMARLALDPDIRLYGWFRRDWRGQRQDLGELAQRWNQLYVAARQACGNLGCDANTRQVGFVEYSSPVPLDALAGNIGPAGTPREVSFTLLPRNLPDTQDIEGLRLVDVSGVVRNKTTGATSGLANFRIRHSGAGYMLANGDGRVETLELSEQRSPSFIDGDTELSNRQDSLQSRWSPTANLLPLEGYALFGLYHVKLPSGFDPAKQSLELTFFYQRPKQAAPGATRLPTAALLCQFGGEVKTIDLADVRLLMRHGETGLIDRLSTSESCKLTENRP